MRDIFVRKEMNFNKGPKERGGALIKHPSQSFYVHGDGDRWRIYLGAFSAFRKARDDFRAQVDLERSGFRQQCNRVQPGREEIRLD